MKEPTKIITSFGRWNYQTHDYDDYTPPLRASMRENDMSKLVACANCSRFFEFGNMYTSREIHTRPMGFGLAVCEKCYSDEKKRHDEAKQLRIQKEQEPILAMEKMTKEAMEEQSPLPHLIGSLIGFVVVLLVFLSIIAVLVGTIRWGFGIN